MKNNKKDHSYYMSLALKQAQRAFAKDEVPIGAIIIDAHGTVLARAYNKVEAKQSQCAHAEALAIATASKKVANWRLEGCWLYVTLEPCTMCMGLIRLSRLDGIVYAASSPLFGYTNELDPKQGARVYKKDISIVSGVKADEAQKLMRQFFKKKREQSSEWSKSKKGKSTTN